MIGVFYLSMLVLLIASCINIMCGLEQVSENSL